MPGDNESPQFDATEGGVEGGTPSPVTPEDAQNQFGLEVGAHTHAFMNGTGGFKDIPIGGASLQEYQVGLHNSLSHLTDEQLRALGTDVQFVQAESNGHLGDIGAMVSLYKDLKHVSSDADSRIQPLSGDALRDAAADLSVDAGKTAAWRDRARVVGDVVGGVAAERDIRPDQSQEPINGSGDDGERKGAENREEGETLDPNNFEQNLHMQVRAYRIGKGIDPPEVIPGWDALVNLESLYSKASPQERQKMQEKLQAALREYGVVPEFRDDTGNGRFEMVLGSVEGTASSHGENSDHEAHQPNASRDDWERKGNGGETREEGETLDPNDFEQNLRMHVRAYRISKGIDPPEIVPGWDALVNLESLYSKASPQERQKMQKKLQAALSEYGVVPEFRDDTGNGRFEMVLGSVEETASSHGENSDHEAHSSNEPRNNEERKDEKPREEGETLDPNNFEQNLAMFVRAERVQRGLERGPVPGGVALINLQRLYGRAGKETKTQMMLRMQKALAPYGTEPEERNGRLEFTKRGFLR